MPVTVPTEESNGPTSKFKMTEFAESVMSKSSPEGERAAWVGVGILASVPCGIG